MLQMDRNPQQHLLSEKTGQPREPGGLSSFECGFGFESDSGSTSLLIKTTTQR